MLDETMSTGLSIGVSCSAVEAIGKENYVKVVTGLGALIGAIGGYAICAIPSEESIDMPDPLVCGIIGASVVGILAAGGSYVTGSACEVVNSYIKEKL